jgi:hypothetical protein
MPCCCDMTMEERLIVFTHVALSLLTVGLAALIHTFCSLISYEAGMKLMAISKAFRRRKLIMTSG